VTRVRNRTRTKIVCTLGPASRPPELIRSLLDEGMSVARINYSYGEPSDHAATIANVRAAADAIGEPVAVIGDLQGPKIRLGILDSPIDSVPGQRLTIIAKESASGKDGVLPLPHPEVLNSLRPGGRLLFDDGAVEAVIRAVRDGRAEIEVLVGGRLLSHKGVVAPGAAKRVAALTDKDRADAAHAVGCGADFIALSFAQSSDDIQSLRALLDALPGGKAVGIVAKIETLAAMERLDEILRSADAVMVARGDLGVEISPQEVPMHQKDILRRANRLGVPAITATQMLQSMVDAPRPTRAEASDVANAILDGTDAVMLSAETAVGKYPCEAVAMMREIAAIAETEMPCRAAQSRFAELEHTHPVTDAISDATVRVAEEVGARLIAISTWSGYTARQVARERPQLPIVAMTPSETVRRQLALTWGVESALIPPYADTDEMLDLVARALAAGGWVQPGDLVVVSAGIPTGGGGKTNFLKVHAV
jgi:pyruvate kinase